MIKIYKAALSVLLVVLVVMATVTVTGVFDINKLIKEAGEESTSSVFDSSSYSSVFETITDSGLPLMKTDVENVFYAMSLQGDVEFYEVKENDITKLEKSGTKDLEITCSGQVLPVTIHYVEIDGKTLGYGLFTNENHPEIFLYEYAFCKVTNQFEGYKSKSDLLLLVDIEKDRFYSDHKIYSEAFYLYSDNTTKTFLNEPQRTVDLNARLRSDYKMFKDEILDQSQDRILFFSSRYYNDYDYGDDVDIFISGGTGDGLDNNRYLSDIASLDFWRTEDGVYYFKEKEVEEAATDTAVEGSAEEATENKAFCLKFYDGDESEEIISFEGDIDTDYIICDSWILNIKSGEIYNVISGESKKLDYSSFSTTFIPDIFRMSENGEYCVVRGKNNLGKPSIGVMNFSCDKFITFTDNVFGYVATAQALNDGTVVLSIVAGESGNTYYQLVCDAESFSAVADKNEAEEAEDTTEEDTAETEAENIVG